MGEVKRYNTAGIQFCLELPAGMEFIEAADYARLLERVAILERERDELAAEISRLRAVEAAALNCLDAASMHSTQFDRPYVLIEPPEFNELAEACGRKA